MSCVVVKLEHTCKLSLGEETFARCYTQQLDETHSDKEADKEVHQDKFRNSCKASNKSICFYCVHY